MMTNNDFAYFILTFGRPNNQITYATLKRLNCKNDIYFICSDDDPTLNEYKAKYGNFVKVFNKEQAVKECKIDLMDNFQKKAAVIYARHYSFKIAKELGIENFVMLDDDYQRFYIADFEKGKWANTGTKDGKITYINRLNIESIFKKCFEFYNKIPKLLAFSLSQGGDFIGGVSQAHNKVKRKAMNVFICNVNKPLNFLGSINEDTNFYISYGARDGICFQLHNVKVNQAETQAQAGGLTDIYLDLGTYVKSFYSVMLQPVGCKVKLMGVSHKRLHHHLDYNKICPKIIRQDFKKNDDFKAH